MRRTWRADRSQLLTALLTIVRMDDSDIIPTNRARQFATTRWSMIASAGKMSSPNSKQALETLCETYWLPLYAYVRRRVDSTAEAQDLTQAFFVAFLEKNYVGDANPQRGRFRAFLLTAFKHFLSKRWEKALAQKRGGGQTVVSLDFRAADSKMNIDPASGLTAEQLYDQQWAITLLECVFVRLEEEHADATANSRFQRLKVFIIGDNPGVTYEQVADDLQMTEPAVRKAVSRLRQRYRDLLRAEIGETVAGPEDVEDEIRNLFATFQL